MYTFYIVNISSVDHAMPSYEINRQRQGGRDSVFYHSYRCWFVFVFVMSNDIRPSAYLVVIQPVTRSTVEEHRNTKQPW